MYSAMATNGMGVGELTPLEQFKKWKESRDGAIVNENITIIKSAKNNEDPSK